MTHQLGQASAPPKAEFLRLDWAAFDVRGCHEAEFLGASRGSPEGGNPRLLAPVRIARVRDSLSAQRNLEIRSVLHPGGARGPQFAEVGIGQAPEGRSRRGGQS